MILGVLLDQVPQRLNIIAINGIKKHIYNKNQDNKKGQFWEFIKILDKQLKSRPTKITYDRIMVEMLDNTSIHKKRKVISMEIRMGSIYNSIIFTRTKQNRA